MKLLKWIGKRWHLKWYDIGHGDGWEDGAGFVLEKLVKDGYITKDREFEYVKELYL